MAVQHTAQGNGAPASTPPSRNAHYLDEATGDVYIAVGTSGPEDWKKMLGAEEADAKYQQQGDYVSPGALNTALEEKVDTVPGKGLSTEDYTTAEKQKLAGLEGSHFRGTFLSLSALQAGATGPVPGDYADVDAGVGESVARYVWDDSDSEWVAQGGSADPLTAAQVKTLYESNPDTNAFTDAEKQKLSDLPPGGGGSDDTIIEDFRSASFEALFSRPATPPARLGQKCIQLDNNGTTCEWVAFLDYDDTTLSWARMVLPIRPWGNGTPLVYTVILTADMRAYALHADESTEEGKQTTIRLPALVPDTGGVWGDEVLPHDGMPISLFNGSEYPWVVILDPSLSWQSGYTPQVQAYGFDKLDATLAQQGPNDSEVAITIPPRTSLWIDLSVWRDGTDFGYYLSANRFFLPYTW